MAKTIIDQCPNCGNRNINKVSLTNYFCAECCVEIDNKGKVYSIQWDGTLVDYFVNEFEDCG